MDRKPNDSAQSNASQSDIWGQTRNTDTPQKRQTWKIVISRLLGGIGKTRAHVGKREIDVVKFPCPSSALLAKSSVTMFNPLCECRTSHSASLEDYLFKGAP